MMPLLAGALCACTHHFFYNSPDLDVLVALQVCMGCTLCMPCRGEVDWSIMHWLVESH